MLVLLPLMLLITVLVKADSSGPILFVQQRTGRYGVPFSILKFRTMMPHTSPAQQASRSDIRITRVGRFLRRTSLDELPQLLNVLRGDMSMVGPRPHPIWLDREFSATVPNLACRYSGRPGITGLAQIKGCRGEVRDERSMANRVHYDLDYLARSNLLLDLRILARTAFRIWTDPHAY